MFLLEFFIAVIILMLFCAVILTIGMFLIKYLVWLQSKVFPDDEEDE